MPKHGSKASPEQVRTIRAVFKEVIDGHPIFAALVAPKLKASKVKPRDKALVREVVKLFKTNKALRDAVRSELTTLGIRPKRNPK